MGEDLGSWSARCVVRRILVTFVVVARLRCNAATCTTATVDALLEFRSAFNDPRDRVFSSWEEARGADCCTWAGVTCQNNALVVLDLEGPSVTSADRVTSNRSYTAKPGHSLNKLQDLQTLKLKNLQFSSRIPSQWSSFSDSLVAVTANDCDLQESIPSGIASNSKLQTLDLKSNNLTGEIPSRLCDIQSLKYLDLSYNDLDTNAIPNCITNGGSITNVNYGHQSSSSDDDDDENSNSGSSSRPYVSNTNAGSSQSKLSTMTMIQMMLLLLLLPLFSIM